jgi:hypothetical protein
MRTLIGLTACMLFVGCTEIDTADSRQAKQTAQMLAEADRQIGMPDITRFTERKLAKDILELRDDEITTYCYIVNLEGKLIFMGEAIGFGLPYSVQFTNPEKFQKVGEGTVYSWEKMPQADPNGLFMPGGLSATWVMLKGPDGKVHPVYMEPEIIVSPFPLHEIDAEQN